ILLYRYSNQLLNKILSGQLDADRMDYLLRDAYFTGTTYGNFDLERILRTMRVKDDKLVVKMSGIHTVEDYIMARYHMYWQVYYHPIARSYEGMLMMLFKRMKDVYMVNPIMFNDAKMFIPFINNKDISVEDYLRMDEAAILYGLNILCDSSDKILSDISNRLLNRRLFKYINVDNEDEVLAIKDKVVKLGYDPNYYLYRDHRNQRPYQPYDSEQGHNIWILEDNSIIELSKISVIVRAITSAKMKEENKLFFPID
ncbi:MAG: phosphohydrolase, partial [Erysipelotrichaceae bacterium]